MRHLPFFVLACSGCYASHAPAGPEEAVPNIVIVPTDSWFIPSCGDGWTDGDEVGFVEVAITNETDRGAMVSMVEMRVTIEGESEPFARADRSRYTVRLDTSEPFDGIVPPHTTRIPGFNATLRSEGRIDARGISLPAVRLDVDLRVDDRVVTVLGAPVELPRCGDQRTE